MTTRISRRAWWMLTGGAVVASVSASIWWKDLLPGVRPAKAQLSTTYVDHDGWIVSAKDKERLGGS